MTVTNGYVLRAVQRPIVAKNIKSHDSSLAAVLAQISRGPEPMTCAAALSQRIVQTSRWPQPFTLHPGSGSARPNSLLMSSALDSAPVAFASRGPPSYSNLRVAFANLDMTKMASS